MDIEIVEIRKGSACTIVAIGTGDECPMLVFLQELERTGSKELVKINIRLDRCAQHGKQRNTDQCRKLVGSELWEFKTTGGVRVFFFEDEGKLIVCTHAFLKKQQKTPPAEISRGEKWRVLYFQAKAAGNLRTRTQKN